MKTHKRHYKTPANKLAQDIESDFFEQDYYAQDARWKRKNRTSQLKRSLEKYKYGTHLCGSVGAAYRRLQGLDKLGKNATIQQWLHYMRELHQIQEHITCAISNAGILIAAVAERKAKERKETHE